MDDLVEGTPDVDDSIPQAAKRRMLRKWLFGNEIEDIGFDAVEHILELMEKGNGSRSYDLNGRHRIVVEYGKPRIEERSSNSGEPKFRLTTEQSTGWRKDHGKGAGILPAEASFSAAKVGTSPLEVRGWQAGDRIEPLGMEGSRKLQDILTDQKIPQASRQHIPGVVCRGQSVRVPGYRIARGWEVEKANEKSIHARLEQNGTE